MHKEILSEEQTKLLPLVQKFSENFGLVGGTAIALQIGHRRSIDFDLFTLGQFDNDITLGAMKAFALGKRAKWKDYIDLYFIFKRHPFGDVVEKAKRTFLGEFNEKLFREELSYFDDIDYTETIDYLPGFITEDKDVVKNLQEISIRK